MYCIVVRDNVKFYQMPFCISGDNLIVLLRSITIINYSNRLSNIETSLYPEINSFLFCDVLFASILTIDF